MTPAHAFRPLPLAIALQAVFAFSAHAQFTVTPGPADNTGKTLAGASGTVQAGATLSTAGGTAAVTVTGNGTSAITNAGTIAQTGTGRTIDSNANSPTLTITNEVGGLITAAGGEAIRLNRAGGSYILNNQGTISQTSAAPGASRAIKADANFTSTNNQVINGSASNTAALISAAGNDAIRLGSNFTLTNFGTIVSTGTVNTSCPGYLQGPPNQCVNDFSAADGVAIENERSNVVILNHGTIEGPRHGIDGGDPVATTADSNLVGIDRLEILSTGPNGVTFAKTVAGVTSEVKIVNPVVVNYIGGSITGHNGSGVGLDGHGVVFNYGTITGDYAGAGNIYDHEGLGLTTSNGDGDGVDIDGMAYIENHGVIQGLGAGGLDSGGSPNGADGIAAGGGTIINMAGASIYGLAKGILIDDGSAGTTTAQRGTDGATGGAARIYNDGRITGAEETAIGLVGNFDDILVNGSTGIITGGAQSVQVDVSGSTTAAAAIQMGAGNDTLTNHGRIEGLNGLAIDMGAGNDTTQLFAGGGSGVVIGTIDGGDGVDTLEIGGLQTFSEGTVRHYESFIVRDGRTTFDYALGAVTSVQVDASAALQVNGAMSTSGDFTVNGRWLAPTGNTLRTIEVGGNYAQGAGGVLQARLAASGQSDQLIVTGSATFADGATVHALPLGYVTDGASYTLVSANGGLTANTANLQLLNDSALVNYTLSGTGQDLVLTAQRSTTLAALAAQGGANLGNLGGALDALGQGAGGSSNALLGLLDAQTSTKAVQDALSQLAPEHNGASQQAAQMASSALFSVLDGRMDTARGSNVAQGRQTGLSAGDTGQRTWVQGLGAWGEQKSRGAANGYKIDAYGLAAGFETDRSAQEVAGLTVGLSHANADGSGVGRGDDVRLQAAQIGGYFSRNLGGMTLDASAVLGHNRYDSARRVVIGGTSTTVNGDYKGWQIGGQVEAGFPFVLQPALTGRWLVGGRAGYLSTDSYTESGDPVVALRVGSNDASSLQSVLGAELTRTLSAGSALQLRARYLHEFADTNNISAAFVAGGPRFTTRAAKADRDALQLGIGLRHEAAKGVAITVRYDAEMKSKYLSHQLSARANWSF